MFANNVPDQFSSLLSGLGKEQEREENSVKNVVSNGWIGDCPEMGGQM